MTFETRSEEEVLKDVNYKEKALAHVRSVCPELMELSFGCEIEAEDGLATFVTKENQYQTRSFLHHGHNRCYRFEKSEFEKEYKIIGHTPHLEHWSRGIGSKEQFSSNLTAVASNGCIYKNGVVVMQFNLTSGQPATEEDYQAYCRIVGV